MSISFASILPDLILLKKTSLTYFNLYNFIPPLSSRCSAPRLGTFPCPLTIPPLGLEPDSIVL
jgi:hypothetical protein